MIVYRFDGSFDGLLTAVFDSFVRKERPDLLLSPAISAPLFWDVMHDVVTDGEKAGRVWKKLGKVISGGARSAFATAFLTDNSDFPTHAMNFARRAVVSTSSVESDFSDESVLAVLKECRRVRGEAHRILQFVRFQKGNDGTYFGMVEPMFDILPMTVGHFRNRFNDQRFILYDRGRDYGYFYDGQDVKRMSFSGCNNAVLTGRLDDCQMDSEERLYQKLWRTYFGAIAIEERINPRKQRQDMPVRYWKYLTEMNGK